MTTYVSPRTVISNTHDRAVITWSPEDEAPVTARTAKIYRTAPGPLDEVDVAEVETRSHRAGMVLVDRVLGCPEAMVTGFYRVANGRRGVLAEDLNEGGLLELEFAQNARLRVAA